MSSPGLEFLSSIAKHIDFEALFAALPEDEFAKLIDDRMERISEEERSIAASEERIAKYKLEADSFRGALRIKRELKERRDAAAHAASEAKVHEATQELSPRKLMQKKRAAAIRVLETDPGRDWSPDQTEALILERGLLTEAEMSAGTPMRIVLAKLVGKGSPVVRSRPGRYQLAGGTDYGFAAALGMPVPDGQSLLSPQGDESSSMREAVQRDL